MRRPPYHVRRVELYFHPGCWAWGLFRTRGSRRPFVVSNSLPLIVRRLERLCGLR